MAFPYGKLSCSACTVKESWSRSTELWSWTENSTSSRSNGGTLLWDQETWHNIWFGSLTGDMLGEYLFRPLNIRLPRSCPARNPLLGLFLCCVRWKNLYCLWNGKPIYATSSSAKSWRLSQTKIHFIRLQSEVEESHPRGPEARTRDESVMRAAGD